MTPEGECSPPRPVRLLTLTTLFPSSVRPRHGIFVANRLGRICDTGRVQATVYAAVPRFPWAYGEFADTPPCDEVMGLTVRHPRYLSIPAVGMGVQPDLLARALLAELDRNRLDGSAFDLVEAHYFFPDGVAAAKVAARLGRPLVISARGSDINLIGEMKRPRARMLAAARQAAALLAVSKALADRMVAMGMDGDKVHVLRNGVDAEVFQPLPRAEARGRLGIDMAERLVLGVGNLVPEKGFELLVRVVAAMPDVRLLLIGNGPLRGPLSALADSLAPGRVSFLDNMAQGELRVAYSAVDLLALPSLREGWPNVVLEALACGTPVVAAAVGGVPEMVGGSAGAVVLGDRNEDSWRNAIRRLLDRPPGLDDTRGHALAFGWDDVVSRQCDLYERIARQQQAAGRSSRSMEVVGNA